MADKKVDPTLFVPLVDGYEYADDLDRRENTDDTSVEDIYTSFNDDGLQPPDSIRFVEQIYTKGSDGRTTVSLVIEVDDVVGATEYEVRRAAL